MANVLIYSNESAMPTNAPLPFEPMSRNFYVLIAQCEQFAGHAASYINTQIALIPLSDNERFVVTL